MQVAIKPVDCFITSHVGRSKEREYFLGLTQLSLWANGVQPKVIEKPMLERYYECERLAKSEIYILCDDDIVFATQDTIIQLVAIMEEHPEYSQLSIGWKRDMKSEENNSWIRSKTVDKDGNQIWEFDHVGGMMAIRKGTIIDKGYKAEYESGYGDDRVMGKIAREQGLKVGVVPHLYFYHLGGDYSTFNPKTA